MFRFLTWSRILMIYIFISPPSFHYQTQSSLVSPGNEHYVLSHRQSVQSGPLGDVQSTRGLALSSFTHVIVTQSTFLCLFLSLHTISCGATGTNSISCVSHSSIGFLNTYPHGDQALTPVSLLTLVSQDLLLTPATSKWTSRFHYLREQTTHITQPVHSIKALFQDYQFFFSWKTHMVSLIIQCG